MPVVQYGLLALLYFISDYVSLFLFLIPDIGSIVPTSEFSIFQTAQGAMDSNQTDIVAFLNNLCLSDLAKGFP